MMTKSKMLSKLRKTKKLRESKLLRNYKNVSRLSKQNTRKLVRLKSKN